MSEALERDYKDRIEKLEIERDAFRTDGVLWRRWADGYLGGGGAPDRDLRKLLDDRLRRLPGLEADNERLGRDVNTACANHQEEQREHAKTSLALREARAQLEDLRGRKLGNADSWAEAASEATGMYDHMRGLHEALKATIRSLLDIELPAGELRKAVGELVR